MASLSLYDCSIQKVGDAFRCDLTVHRVQGLSSTGKSLSMNKTVGSIKLMLSAGKVDI